MSSDPATVSRTRKFGRRLFSSNKTDDPSTRSRSSSKVGQELRVDVGSKIKQLELATAPPSPKPFRPVENRRASIVQPALNRRQSKTSSLFDLFSKPKVERARGAHESVGAQLPPVREQQPQQPPIPNHVYTRPDRSRRESTLAQDEPVTNQPSPPRPASRLSIVPQTTLPAREPQPPTAKQLEHWETSPLFQAYPQSIKHGRLQGISNSTETLLRSQQNRYNGGMDGFAQDPQAGAPDRPKRLSLISESPDLMEKVFALVTAGRLVQYSGTGNSDRMPEKVLQLGPKSAAFACDLIPGKHWVVQVVQSTNDMNMPSVKPSRSILSRLRVSNMSRRHATSLLLIFSSPEDMDSWLKAIRGVIESLGGKQRNNADPEHKQEREQEIAQKRLSQMPSHRFLVQRDPERFNDDRRDSVSPVTTQSPVQSHENKRLSVALSATSSTGDSPSVTPVDKDSSSSLRSRRISSGTVLTTSSGLSPDLFRLEPLKETSRFSSASTRTSRTSEGEVMTAATSICSSTPPSPRKDSFVDFESPKTPTLKSFSSTPSLIVTSRRRSMQNAPALPALPPMPSTPISPTSPVKRLSIVSAPPTIDRTNRNSKNFLFPRDSPPSTLETADPRQNQSSLASKTPPIPEVESEASSIHIPSRRVSLEPAVIETVKTRPLSGLGQLPTLHGRSRDKLDSVGGNPSSHRNRPFIRPLPVKPSLVSIQPPSRSNSNSSKAASPVESPTPIESPITGSEEMQHHQISQTIREAALQELPASRRTSTVLSAPPPRPPRPDEISPIRSLELLASELQRASSVMECRPTALLNKNAGSRMSLQSLPVTAPPPRSKVRNSFTAPTGPIMLPGRRTSSVGNGMLPLVIPERRYPTAAQQNAQYNTATGVVMQQVQSTGHINAAQASTQSQQPLKLRRPNSLQIRSDHAPFLSSRNNRAGSLSQQSRPQSVSQPPRISVPVAAASQNAAPAPFIPYSRPAPSNNSDSSGFRASILQREHPRFSVRAVSTPASTQKHITSTITVSTTSKVTSPNPSSNGVLRSSSVASPPQTLRATSSAWELSTSSSAKRLSFLRPSSRPLSPPPNPTVSPQLSHRSSLQIRSAMRASSPPPPVALPPLPGMHGPPIDLPANLPPPPPVPPMNPNRQAALRAKHSMPNIAISGLPPPMPPPNRALPRVPSLPEGVGTAQ